MRQATAIPPASPPVAADSELALRAKAVEAALTDVKGMPIDHRTRAVALKEAVEAFHKAGLTQIVRTLRADPRGLELLRCFSATDTMLSNGELAERTGLPRPTISRLNSTGTSRSVCIPPSSRRS